jgi:hypothetical protein
MAADDHLSDEQMHDYRGQHQPMVDESDPGIHNLHELFGEDVYKTPQHYGHGESYDTQAITQLRRAQGRPQARVDIYRSVPPGVRSINTGDWVTTSRDYAKQHGRHPTDPSQDQHVLWAKVNAEHVRTGGNDIVEWGYSGESIPNAQVRWKPRKRS